MLIIMTHNRLSQASLRRPGIPESGCEGTIFLIGERRDGAQASEGGLDDEVSVRIFRCRKCLQTLVVRQRVDQKTPANWLANSFDGPAMAGESQADLDAGRQRLRQPRSRPA